MGLQSKIANLGRLHEIIRAFTLAGFGDILKKMGLEATTERTGKILGWKYTWNVLSVYGNSLKYSAQPLSNSANFLPLARTCSDRSRLVNSKNSNRKPHNWTSKSFVLRLKKIWEHPLKKSSRR